MSRIDITKSTKGRMSEPFRFLVYGVEGVGKSSFAGGAPNPIFLDPTGGTEQLSITRVPRPNEGFTWDDVFDVVEQLRTVEHEYDTLVLDELGELERLCWLFICARDKEPDITGKNKGSKYGYAKGYDVALEEWRKLLHRIERLRREKRMNIILVGHSHIKTFQNPEGSDFDRYEIKLHKKLGGMLKAWCDAVFFCRDEVLVDTAEERGRGMSTGQRVMHTVANAAFESKSRYPLPPTVTLNPNVEVTWQTVNTALDPVLGELTLLRAGLSDENATKLDDAIERASGNTTKLAELVTWARNKQESKAA